MVQRISVQELRRLLAEGAQVVLVDVRQPWEHEIAALPAGVLVPLDELEGRVDEIEAPAGALVVAYCHHGVRSLSAAVLLEQAGFEAVASLSGGIDAWAREVDPGVARY